jgi:hypothetical protein
MPQPSFPLFKPALDEPPDDLVFSVEELVDREVRRAALVGPDSDAVERIRISIDLNTHAIDALQALATALGSSRRATAAKLLNIAIWDAVNQLARRGAESNPDAEPEYQAVLDVFQSAYDELRAKRRAQEQDE